MEWKEGEEQKKRAVRRRHRNPFFQLEKFEKLRSLCCTSEMEKKRLQAEAILGPKKKDEDGGGDGKSPCPPKKSKTSKCDTQKPKELMNVKDKTAMVVGGSSGIGFETSKELLKAGALKVCVVDYRQDIAFAAVDKLNAGLCEPKACPLMADIRSDCAFDMAFREAIRSFCQIDIFINCVGVFDETPECWDQMIRLNLIGSIRGTILAYYYMSQNCREGMPQGGCILNVSSYGAIENIPTMPLYSAASNGINGLTSSFGQDFHFCNSGVRCVALCPSCTTTAFMKKMAKHHYRREWVSHSNSAMKCKSRQSAKDVGRAVVHTIRFGQNGNIYVMVGGKFYRYAMPDYRKIIRRETFLV